MAKKSTKKIVKPTTAKADKVAVVIGREYKKGKAAYIAAGKALIAHKATLKGTFKQWVIGNAKTLGFAYWTATRLMNLARHPNWDMEKVWANEGKKEARKAAKSAPKLATVDGKPVDESGAEEPDAAEEPAKPLDKHELLHIGYLAMVAAVEKEHGKGRVPAAVWKEVGTAINAMAGLIFNIQPGDNPFAHIFEGEAA